MFPGGLETSGVIPVTAHAPAAAVFPGGLETSGVIPVAGTGNDFPDTMVAAREGTSPQTTNGPEPIVVNGQICHQCL